MSKPNRGLYTTIGAPNEGLFRTFETSRLKVTREWTNVLWKFKCLLINLFTLNKVHKLYEEKCGKLVVE
jgi:hypothetical protein